MDRYLEIDLPGTDQYTPALYFRFPQTEFIMQLVQDEKEKQIALRGMTERKARAYFFIAHGMTTRFRVFRRGRSL
jgi:hypothetical protein